MGYIDSRILLRHERALSRPRLLFVRTWFTCPGLHVLILRSSLAQRVLDSRIEHLDKLDTVWTFLGVSHLVQDFFLNPPRTRRWPYFRASGSLGTLTGTVPSLDQAESLHVSCLQKSMCNLTISHSVDMSYTVCSLQMYQHVVEREITNTVRKPRISGGYF